MGKRQKHKNKEKRKKGQTISVIDPINMGKRENITKQNITALKNKQPIRPPDQNIIKRARGGISNKLQGPKTKRRKYPKANHNRSNQKKQNTPRKTYQKQRNFPDKNKQEDSRRNKGKRKNDEENREKELQQPSKK